MKKGVYSEETRNLVRILVEANVSNVHIMGVIEAVLASAGIKAVRCLSAIKASKIAGDILNNKNDKSGHHDQFCSWWSEGDGTNFPFLISQTHIFNLIVKQLQY